MPATDPVLVSIFEPDVTPALRAAAERLVAIKVKADALLGSSYAGLLAPELAQISLKTLDPFGFANLCFPFFENKGARTFPALVPASLVVGDSWQWTENFITRRTPEELANHLLDTRRAIEGDDDCADYFLLAPMGLFIAHEGKNRVRFLRERGASHIPASITTIGYPAAASIQRFRVEISGRIEVWAVLEDCWVQRMPLHAVADEILSAYGIAGPLAWPSRYPTPETVSEHFHSTELTKRVNLVELMGARQKADECITASIFDFQVEKWRSKPIFLHSLVLIASAVLLFIDHPISRYISIFLTGFFMGAVRSLTTKWLVVRRRSLQL